MIVVTGGAGFVGSNIVKGLNARGHDDVVVVDDLTDGAKFRNIADCAIDDYLDKDDFRMRIRDRSFDLPHAVFHQGACSTTTEWDGRFMLDNNFEYSKQLLHYCMQHKVPFVYASSASVYGMGPGFSEGAHNERPLNVYGYSKLLFDQYVRRHAADAVSPVAGLRYFNVYGPREQHKGAMASVVWHFNRQIEADGEARLFEGSDGYADGEQRRDFIYVEDVVDVNVWCLDHTVSGVFNLGTGRSQSFNDIANAVIGWHGKGKIRYIPFPDHLMGRYQSFTEADMTALREVGYTAEFRPVEQGVRDYLDQIPGDRDPD